MFDSFDKYISYFIDDINANDYWHDIGILHASDLIDEFNNSDWDELLQVLSSKPDNWIARFCESIDDTINVEVIPLLINAFKRKNNELSIKILDTMRSLLSYGYNVKNEKIFLLNVISELTPNADTVDLAVLNSLKKDLLS